MSSGRNKPIDVRDARNQPFFWIDKLFIENGYADKIGIYGIGVYTILSYHANREGRCWPSQTSIAKRLGCSVNSVIRAVEKLVSVGLISTSREGVGPDSRIIYEIRNIPPIRVDNPPSDEATSPLLGCNIPPEVMTNNNKETRSKEQQPLTRRKFTSFHDERDQVKRLFPGSLQ